MRSFAIEEPGSPVPALYATLLLTTKVGETWSRGTGGDIQRLVGSEVLGKRVQGGLGRKLLRCHEHLVRVVTV